MWYNCHLFHVSHGPSKVSCGYGHWNMKNYLLSLYISYWVLLICCSKVKIVLPPTHNLCCWMLLDMVWKERSFSWKNNIQEGLFEIPSNAKSTVSIFCRMFFPRLLQLSQTLFYVLCRLGIICLIFCLYRFLIVFDLHWGERGDILIWINWFSLNWDDGHVNCDTLLAKQDSVFFCIGIFHF